MEEGRRRGMLTHQASVIKNPPPNRNLGREARDDYSDDDEDDSASASRTLFDIIQDEESSAASAYSGVFAPAGGGRGGGANKLNWKSFTDRLRIRRTGHAWSSSSQSVPVSDDFRDPSSPRPAACRTRSSALNGSRIGGSAMDLGGSQRPEEEEVEEREKEPGIVSLMSLLRREEDDGEEEEEEEERGEEAEEEEEEENEEELVCCVCMVRHKGAAFIPCGHTFCRMCSRELWASRGNCPLCNGYILEILNIF